MNATATNESARKIVQGTLSLIEKQHSAVRKKEYDAEKEACRLLMVQLNAPEIAFHKFGYKSSGSRRLSIEVKSDGCREPSYLVFFRLYELENPAIGWRPTDPEDLSDPSANPFVKKNRFVVKKDGAHMIYPNGGSEFFCKLPIESISELTPLIVDIEEIAQKTDRLLQLKEKVETLSETLGKFDGSSSTGEGTMLQLRRALNTLPEEIEKDSEELNDQGELGKALETLVSKLNELKNLTERVLASASKSITNAIGSLV